MSTIQRVAIENVTPEQVKKWEKQFGEVKLLEVFDKFETVIEEDGTETEVGVGESKKCYLKKPSRAQAKMAFLNNTTKSGQLDMISPGEILIRSCTLSIDPELETDKNYFKIALLASKYLNEVMGFI